MPLASTSKLQVAYIEEATPGTTPVTGVPKNLRVTGESMKYAAQSESSKEINDTRQTSDRVLVGATVDGGFEGEASYRGYDPFLEGLLSDTFSSVFGTDGVASMTVTIVQAAGTITDDGVDGFVGLVAGQWVSVLSGLNKGLYRIQSMTPDELTVDTDTPLASDETAVTVDISSSRLSIGTAGLRYFSIEKTFADVGQSFIYRGMSPSKLSLGFSAGGILTQSFDFMGFNSSRSGTTQLPGVPTASESHGIMNAVTGIPHLFVDNAPILNTFIKSGNIDIDGALRGQTAVGVLGNVGIGAGTYVVSGTLEMYLADGAIYDRALANQTASFEVPVTDVNGYGYAFVFDNVKFDVPEVVAGGMDADVTLSVPFTAIAPNKATDKLVHIDRFGVIGI